MTVLSRICGGHARVASEAGPLILEAADVGARSNACGLSESSFSAPPFLESLNLYLPCAFSARRAFVEEKIGVEGNYSSTELESTERS